MPAPKKKPTAKTARKVTKKPAPKKRPAPAKKASSKTSKPAPQKTATTPSPVDAAKEFSIEAARLLHDDKCTDVVVLDVQTLSQMSRFIVIGSGTSDRQMHSVIEHVKGLGKQRGFPAWRSDADERGMWLLLDTVDVVVHLFEPNTRAHYDLEMLWGDAPRLEWQRPDQMPRDRAGLNA